MTKLKDFWRWFTGEPVREQGRDEPVAPFSEESETHAFEARKLLTLDRGFSRTEVGAVVAAEAVVALMANDLHLAGRIVYRYPCSVELLSLAIAELAERHRESIEDEIAEWKKHEAAEEGRKRLDQLDELIRRGNFCNQDRTIMLPPERYDRLKAMLEAPDREFRREYVGTFESRPKGVFEAPVYAQLVELEEHERKMRESVSGVSKMHAQGEPLEFGSLCRVVGCTEQRHNGSMRYCRDHCALADSGRLCVEKTGYSG